MNVFTYEKITKKDPLARIGKYLLGDLEGYVPREELEKFKKIFCGEQEPIYVSPTEIVEKYLKSVFSEYIDKGYSFVAIGNGGLVLEPILKETTGMKEIYSGVVDVKRIYNEEGRKPRIEVRGYSGKEISNKICCVDDVVASGRTANKVAEWFREIKSIGELELITIISSGDLRNSKREENGNVKGYDKMIVGIEVNNKKGFPAIFSIRALLKALEDRSYENYLNKYLDTQKLKEMGYKLLEKYPEAKKVIKI